MSRKHTPRPKISRTLERAPVFRDTPRLLSSEEKRELIRAHAAIRAPQDPLQRVSLWAGIFVAIAVILGGWWLTVGWQIKRAVSESGTEVRKMTERLNEFAEQVDDSPIIKNSIPSPTSQAAAAELGERIRASLESAASSSIRETDLMAPQAPGAPTSSEATALPYDASSLPLPVDPKTPGLSPDDSDSSS